MKKGHVQMMVTRGGREGQSAHVDRIWPCPV